MYYGRIGKKFCCGTHITKILGENYVIPRFIKRSLRNVIKVSFIFLASFFKTFRDICRDGNSGSAHLADKTVFFIGGKLFCQFVYFEHKTMAFLPYVKIGKISDFFHNTDNYIPLIKFTVTFSLIFILCLATLKTVSFVCEFINFMTGPFDLFFMMVLIFSLFYYSTSYYLLRPEVK